MVKVMNSTWTPPDDYFRGADGVYRVTLISIGVTDNDSGEFTPGATRTFESDGRFGKGEAVVQDWTFALDDGQIIQGSCSAPKVKNGEEVIHPKSKYFAWMTALSGGKTIPEGTEFDPQKHLVGREALATIQHDESGYPKIINLGAAPPAPAPAAAAPAQAAPLRETVGAATSGDGLPF